MHYRHNEFQNLALDALHRKSTLAFIRHCSRVGGGDDKLAIDKGGNLPEKVIVMICYTRTTLCSDTTQGHRGGFGSPHGRHM